MVEPKLAVPTKQPLGESIIWHSIQACLYWIDLLNPTLYRHDPASCRTESWPLPLPAPLGAIVATTLSDVLLVSHRHGISLLDTTDLGLSAYVDPENGRDAISYNDMKCDRWERLWAGTSHLLEREPRGVLWCIADRTAFALADSGFAVSNGPAFSRDGRTMYFNDTLGRQTLAYDIEMGSLLPRNRRVIRTYAQDEGMPDGATVDADDNIWIAHWGGSRISRMTPAGALLQTYPLPALNITTMCFGGPDLRTLYVTTARDGMSPAQLDAMPLSGSVFSLDVETQGLPEPLAKAS